MTDSREAISGTDAGGDLVTETERLHETLCCKRSRAATGWRAVGLGYRRHGAYAGDFEPERRRADGEW